MSSGQLLSSKGLTPNSEQVRLERTAKLCHLVSYWRWKNPTRLILDPWSIHLTTNYTKKPVLTIQFAPSNQQGNPLFYRFQATDTITIDKKPNNWYLFLETIEEEAHDPRGELSENDFRKYRLESSTQLDKREQITLQRPRNAGKPLRDP